MKNALIQLNEQSFKVHFPNGTFADLKAACTLLSPGPVQDLQTGVDAETRAQTEILITGWGSKPLTPEILATLPNLELVAHLGGTVKSVLSQAALKNGLRVTNAADVNAKPVAQFALAFIILHNKRVLDWQRAYARDRTSFDLHANPMVGNLGNRDKVIGIVGASRVGRALISLLQPHGLRILVHDPVKTDDELRGYGAEPTPLDALLAQSDVVSLHQPLLPETRKSFGAREFALMKDGALFLNTARGAIADQDALTKAMAGGRLNAVLDVTDPEPLPDKTPLWDMPNVILTPHVAGSLGTEVADMTDEIIAEIRRFTKREALLHEVSLGHWAQVA